MSQYTINDSTSFSDKKNTPDASSGDTATDDRPQLLTWLSPLDPGLRHWEIQERRVSDVGEWLMKTKEFRRWCELDREGDCESAVLFCYGDPGVGKTFISSLVVDRLCDQTSGQNAAVSCFYLDFAARKEQSATNVLGSLLKQMVSGMERIPDEISRAFGQQKTTIGGRRPQLADIVKMLQAVTSSRPTFMCLDGLDECGRVQRARLLDSLNQILEKSPCARILATGRSYIRAEVEKRLAGQVASVSVSPNRGDITRFLRVRLGEDETLDAMDDSLEADILEEIPENMSQMFRLVSLNIEAILQESTIYRRRERLSKMADGLGWGDAYGTTIERIIAQDGDKPRLGVGALMWVSHAERPLEARELCQALAIELGSKNFNAGNVPSISTLVACCQGLITVDEETSTVRLVHFTLQEYLLARSDIFKEPHSAMAKICLTYLNSEHLNGLAANPHLMSRGEPFLKYSSRYWGVHAKRETSNAVKSLALELLREYDSHISAGYLLAEADFPNAWGLRTRSDTRFGALHCASFFGITEFATTLIDIKRYYINGRDILGRTPLAWAARNGHGGAVKMLLRQEGINPGIPDNGGRTPLSYAAQGGNEAVVKILLGREGFKSDEPCNYLRTPLSYAAQYGSKEVVKILLGREEVNPDKADSADRTPLWWAARDGHEVVVRILLGREEVNPDKADYFGETPLLCAALGGHEGVVKILLGREWVNPDNPNEDGRTPLLAAIEGGHEGVVKILLARQEVNAAWLSYNRRTPLSFAAEYGHEGVVKILLGWEGVDPNMPDDDGRPPLSYAARHGSQGVMKILLEREEVNAEQTCKDSRTPLSYAAEYGSEGAVKILLEREEVSPCRSAFHGRTPLSYAAGCACEGVVRILLRREEVNPDEPDNRGRTPLSYAVEGRDGRARKGVVRILLGREEVNPDKPDNDGRTPLSYAVGGRIWHASEELMRMLLGHEEVNPDKPDNHGRTPLSYAARGGDGGVVTTLLGLKEVSPDKPDNDGRTPLSYAAEGGRERSVKALLAREEVNPNKPDNNGRTPLILAASKGNSEVVALLQPYKAVNSAT